MASNPELSASRSRFVAALGAREFLLTEGAILERIRRDSGIPLDPHIAHAALLYSNAGRAALCSLWREYAEIARAADVGILLCTPTWRSTPERLASTDFPNVTQVSRDAVELLHELRAEFGDFSQRIFIGGIFGCRGDAYKPEESLNAEAAARYHAPQIAALEQAGVDFLLATTLPAFSEALGMAHAMRAVNCPSLLSFVLRPKGTLLDGTPVAEAIAAIDAQASPTAYLANCVHPLRFESALNAAEQARQGVKDRLIGLQGNTSKKSPEEFDGAENLDSDDPQEFAEVMARIRQRFGTRILGGCCGTDGRHIAAIARSCIG